MLTEEYTVRLANFQGPLDLLLFLIRRAEVDVTEVSIGEIADQYLHFLGDLTRIDVEAAGEFLVTAAALLEIKSRLLAPATLGDGELGESGSAAESLLGGRTDPTNPAADLIRQLLAYRKFRDAADRLSTHRSVWDRRYPLGKLGAPELPADFMEESSDLEYLSLFDLIQAYARIAETVQFDRLGDHRIVADDTPIELHAADVLDLLRRADQGESTPARLTMAQLFATKEKVEIIGLFLAILELVRQRAIHVIVDEATRNVCIALRESACNDEAHDSANATIIEEKLVTPEAWDDDDPFEADDDANEDQDRR